MPRGMGHLAPLLASFWTQQATWVSHSGQAWVPRGLWLQIMTPHLSPQPQTSNNNNPTPTGMMGVVTTHASPSAGCAGYRLAPGTWRRRGLCSPCRMAGGI